MAKNKAPQGARGYFMNIEISLSDAVSVYVNLFFEAKRQIKLYAKYKYSDVIFANECKKDALEYFRIYKDIKSQVEKK
jgi:hypothetical protein